MSVQTKCKSCAGDQVRVLGERDGYAIARCQACGLMFMPDTPSETELMEFYKHDKLDKWERNQSVDLGAFGEQFISTPSSKRDWFDKVLRDCERLRGKPRLKILEIGSAKGVFVAYARGGGHEAYGTEGSPEVVELLNKSYPGWFTFVPGCDYRSQFEDGTFDLVYLEHVFEHLPEAPSLIEQFWHLLAPGGVLMIMVPNHACRRARHLGLRFDGFTPPAHLFYFTPESLQHVLTSRGFEICQTEAVCMWHRMVWQSYSLDNHLNRALRGVRKLTRLPMPAVAAGESYPKGILQHVRVLPYYWSALLAGLSGQSVDDELVIFARKIPITNGAPTH